MVMIEIGPEKVENLAEHLEKGIRYIGKAMQCIDEIKSQHHMGERMGRRHYDSPYEDQHRSEWEHEQLGERMGYRGRYSRY